MAGQPGKSASVVQDIKEPRPHLPNQNRIKRRSHFDQMATPHICFGQASQPFIVEVKAVCFIKLADAIQSVRRHEPGSRSREIVDAHNRVEFVKLQLRRRYKTRASRDALFGEAQKLGRPFIVIFEERNKFRLHLPDCSVKRCSVRMGVVRFRNRQGTSSGEFPEEVPLSFVDANDNNYGIPIKCRLSVDRRYRALQKGQLRRLCS